MVVFTKDFPPRHSVRYKISRNAASRCKSVEGPIFVHSEAELTPGHAGADQALSICKIDTL